MCLLPWRGAVPVIPRSAIRVSRAGRTTANSLNKALGLSSSRIRPRRAATPNRAVMTVKIRAKAMSETGVPTVFHTSGRARTRRAAMLVPNPSRP